MHRRLSIIFGTAAIFSFTKAGLTDTYQQGDFEEFYKTPLNTTRYPGNTAGYAMQFDQDVSRWTWYNPQNFQTNVPLPNYPKAGETGLKARLS